MLRVKTARLLLPVFALVMANSFVSSADTPTMLLRVEPTEVTFHKMENVGVIRVFLGGKPAAKSQIESLSIEGSYGRMFFIEQSEGQLGTVLVRANPSQLEVGTYKLLIRAAKQLAEVTIHAPLDTLESVIDIESKLQSSDPTDVKLQYGLAQYFGQEKVEISLPEKAYEGYVLKIPLPKHDDRLYTWFINDEPVLSGKGESTLRLPLKEEGYISIRVEIKKEGIPPVSWQGNLSVLSEPEIRTDCILGETVSLTAPDGFKQYQWEIDGKSVGHDKVYRFKPSELGTIRVQCYASIPTQEESDYVFRRITWIVNVTEKEKGAF